MVTNLTENDLIFGFCISARTKNRLWGKHVTGNPAPCPIFNDQDLAILRILGDTPSFKGVKGRKFDTPIVMSTDSQRTTFRNVRACRADVVATSSNITKSINTGWWVECMFLGFLANISILLQISNDLLFADRWCDTRSQGYVGQAEK